MNWNPFKRIAELERDVRTYAAQLSDLARSNKGRDAWVASLETRLQDLQKQIGNPSPVVTISRADVEKEAKARLKRAAYARKYYANKRAAKAAAGGAK